MFALLSLTVVRMLLVYVSLAGTGEDTPSKLFLGWFGPRGLASLVFAFIVLNANFPSGKLLALVVVVIVFLVLLHMVFLPIHLQKNERERVALG